MNLSSSYHLLDVGRSMSLAGQTPFSFQQKAKAPKTQSIIKRLKFRWKDWIEGCSNWWFGSRWFRILGVPLINHPFHEGIPCIQTTGPKTTNKPYSDLKTIETRQLLGTKTFSEKVILVTIPIVFFVKLLKSLFISQWV